MLEHAQLPSVTEYNSLQKSLGRPVLCRAEYERHLISYLYRILCPAGARQLAGTQGFHAPMHDIALGVLGVQENQGMRVCPDEPRYGSLQSERILLVVCGISMVRPDRVTRRQSPYHQGYEDKSLSFHYAIPTLRDPRGCWFWLLPQCMTNRTPKASLKRRKLNQQPHAL